MTEAEVRADERQKLRAAFWAYFHKSGDHYFDTPEAGASEAECTSTTAMAWTHITDLADLAGK